ncbi:hypothetical protein JCM1840_006297 [Sporobolomyces johnsonii]
MVSFALSDAERQLVKEAADFASTVLPAARTAYLKETTPHARFLATKPFYEQAVKAGLVAGVEELCAIDPSSGLNMIANGLGLAPIITGGTPGQQQKFLLPFVTKEGAPLSSLCFSEVRGSANWLNERGDGVRTTIVRVGNEWVVNGEKQWATSSAGWDFKGSEINCVVGRTDLGRPPKESIAVVVVTREDIERNELGAFSVANDFETIGMLATSGPHIRYKNLRVPLGNMLGEPGEKAIDIVERSFTESAALVGAMSVGIMRHAFEVAIEFAKTQDRGGPSKIISHQSVSDLLIYIKSKLEAVIFTSEAAIEVVTKAAQVVGVSSYTTDLPFGSLLQDALCMSIFDGGNVGVRRRQLQKMYAEEGYDVRSTTRQL